MISRTALLGVLALTLAASACVDDTKTSASDRAAKLAAYVLDAPPVMAHTSDLLFDGKVRLLGYKMVPESAVAAGGDVKLTLYWQVDTPLDAGWMLFTHLLDDHGNRLANLDTAGPLRNGPNGQQALPPGAWLKGKVYVDELSFRVPAEASGELSVVVGIWRGETRLPVSRGTSDKENRGLLLKFSTNGSVAPKGLSTPLPPNRQGVPSLDVLKIEGEAAPMIDGKLDDPAWKFGAPTGAFIDVTNGQPNRSFPVNASAKITWDDQALYLGFEVKDDDILGGYHEGDVDPHLWEKSCVEIMIDPDGDGDNRDYYEIQISPQNLIFDSQFDNYNAPKGGENGPFGHQDWSIQGKTAVVVDGTIDKHDDKDRGYTVEAAIPWTSFSKARVAPPKPGDSWRINMYAMRNNGGVAWSPILGQGNFHRATRFGRVKFQTRASVQAAASALASARNAPDGPIPAPDLPIPAASGKPVELGVFGPPPPPADSPPLTPPTIKPVPTSRKNPSIGFVRPPSQ